tara:strand:- start:5852 stop:6355 length:504 start_codon:yes stop_codon:yes gene_type:complete
MSERIILQIPIPAHLMNFMQQELKAESSEIKIQANSTLGVFLMGVIEESNKPMPKPADKSFFEIAVPAQDRLGKSYDGRNKWLTVSPTNIKRFHQLIETLMYRELFSRLDLIYSRGEAQRKGGKMTVEIERFIAKYSDDRAVLSLDALRKAYYRYRKSGQSQLRRMI